MAKQWKKLQRADSAFTGDVTGTVNGASAASVKSGSALGSSSNQDSTSTIRSGTTATNVGLGNVPNYSAATMRSGVTKTDVGLSNVANETRATILAGTFTGNVTGTVDGEAASSIKSKANEGSDAKDAVDGNAAVTMVGGSINIGSGEWTVDSSGNQVTKGTITINKDSGGTAGLKLDSGSSGSMSILMEGANPDLDIGGTSPLGTSTLKVKRGGTGNSCRIFFYNGGSTIIGSVGYANQPTAYTTQLAMHAGTTYDNTSPYFERDFTIDADHKVGFWANAKSFAGVTIGSDGTNKGLYVKNGGLGVGATTTTDGEVSCSTLRINSASSTNFQGGTVQVGSLTTSNSGSTSAGVITNANSTGAGINWGGQNEFYLNAGAVRQVTIGTSNVTFAGDITIDGRTKTAHTKLKIQSNADNNYDAIVELHQETVMVWQLLNDGSDSDKFKIKDAGGSTAVTIDQSVNTTFGGNISTNQDMYCGGEFEVGGNVILEAGGDSFFEGGIECDNDITWDGGGSVESNAAYDAMGWHGSTSRIKMIPSDFMPNDDSTTYNVGVVDNGGKIKAMSSSLEAYGMYPIPMGFKATKVRTYGSDSLNNVNVYEGYITTTTTTSKGSGKIGNNIDITDVTASTNNYLIVKWSPTSTSDYFYGGYITIVRV